MNPLSYIMYMWTLATGGQAQGIWFFAAIYTLAVASYSLYFQLLTRSWPDTEGKLIDIGSERFGAPAFNKSDQQYVSRAV